MKIVDRCHVIAQGGEGKTGSCHSLLNRMSDASPSLFTSFVFSSACLRGCLDGCVFSFYTSTLTSLAIKFHKAKHGRIAKLIHRLFMRVRVCMCVCVCVREFGWSS